MAWKNSCRAHHPDISFSSQKFQIFLKPSKSFLEKIRFLFEGFYCFHSIKNNLRASFSKLPFLNLPNSRNRMLLNTESMTLEITLSRLSLVQFILATGKWQPKLMFDLESLIILRNVLMAEGSLDIQTLLLVLHVLTSNMLLF